MFSLERERGGESQKVWKFLQSAKDWAKKIRSVDWTNMQKWQKRTAKPRWRISFDTGECSRQVRKSAPDVLMDGIECSWLSLLGQWGTECGWVGLAQRFLVGWTKISSSSLTPAGWVPESHLLGSWVFLFLLFLRTTLCIFCFPVTEINTG